MSELPPEVVAALREYVVFRGGVLMLEDKQCVLKDKAQRCIDPSVIKETYELIAQNEIRLEHMKKIQQQTREKLNTLIGLKRVGFEAIIKALS